MGKKSRITLLICLALLAVIYTARSNLIPKTKPEKSGFPTSFAYPQDHRPPISSEKSVIKSTESSALNPHDPSSGLTLQEIMKSDNLCAFQNKWSQDGDDVEEIYFENSQFQYQYEALKMALRGERPYEKFALLVYYLRKANLLAHSSPPLPSTEQDLNEAHRGFAALESSDPGNGDLIALQIATLADTNDPELEALLERLEKADHFDSYFISYADALSMADDPSAIGYLVKVGYYSRLPVPDWMKIRELWSKNLKLYPKSLSTIAQLMTQDGLKTRRPAYLMGFNVLEYSMGRAIFKKLKTVELPNFIEINNQFPQYTAWIDKTGLSYLTQFSDSCDDQLKGKILNYVKALRERGWGLGTL